MNNVKCSDRTVVLLQIQLIGRTVGSPFPLPTPLKPYAIGKRAWLTGAISSGTRSSAHFARLYEQFRGITRVGIYGGNICRSTLTEKLPGRRVGATI